MNRIVLLLIVFSVLLAGCFQDPDDKLRKFLFFEGYGNFVENYNVVFYGTRNHITEYRHIQEVEEEVLESSKIIKETVKEFEKFKVPARASKDLKATYEVYKTALELSIEPIEELESLIAANNFDNEEIKAVYESLLLTEQELAKVVEGRIVAPVFEE